MLWVSYGKASKEGMKGMITKPEMYSAEPYGKLVEAYGGKLISYLVLLNGDIDIIVVMDIPDDRIADVAFVNAMLLRGSGRIESLTTVPAIRWEDALPLMQKAQQMAPNKEFRG